MYRFWGKTDSGELHLCIYHCLDVAAVCNEFLINNNVISNKLSCLLGLNKKDTITLITYLAALHDIGKFSCGFQNKVKNAVKDLNTPIKEITYSRSFDHGSFGARWLQDAFSNNKIKTVNDFSKLTRIEKRQIKVLYLSTCIHHGKYYNDSHINNKEYNNEDYEPIDQIRIKVSNELFELFKPNFNDIKIKTIRPTILLIAGIVSICDWLGSNKVHFPFETKKLQLKDYYESKHKNAYNAIKESGLLYTADNAKINSLENIFDFELRPLQQSIVNLPISAKMIVIEAPTGEGKTEASYLALLKQLESKNISGAYFALPTKATANALFDRTQAFINNSLTDTIVTYKLSHSSSWLHDNYRQIINKNDSIDEYFNLEASVISTKWMQSSKKSLLSAFGVGTVDQAMTCALSTRHFFVRLFGLIKGAVIFDEIHAYDIYMDTIINRLLEWLGVFKIPVILLSATLPKSKKKDFINSYLGGENKLELKENAYPLITTVINNNISEIAGFEAAIKRNIKLNYIDAEDETALINKLKDKLNDNGCICIITNTVKRCQEIYNQLKDLEIDIPITVFHSNFTSYDRKIIEESLVKKFGKPVNNPNRPKKAILIATQVVEQSLDLDFDYMISDIAPIDLIVQRAGRLHRHDNRKRPTNKINPELTIMIQRENPGFYVYHNTVVLRTMLALKDKQSLKTPEETREIVDTVYPDKKELNEIDYHIQLDNISIEYTSNEIKKWNVSENKERNKMENTAREFAIPNPWENRNMSIDAFADDDAKNENRVKAVTRFGIRSRSVILLFERNKKLYTSDDKEIISTGTPLNLLVNINDFNILESIIMSSISIDTNKEKETLNTRDKKLEAEVKELLNTNPALKNEEYLIIKPGVNVIYDPKIGFQIKKDKTNV